MTPLFLPLPGNEAMTAGLAAACGGAVAALELRRFPDGETYVRVDTPVAGRHAAIVATLDRPDPKIAPLLLLAATLRDLGASSVGLVAPYLAYMRQDARFRPGEGITSEYFARLVSNTFDWLVTVDPHLHRHESLDAVYSVPARAVQAAPLMARWISGNIAQPLLVGPDAESAQWAGAVAAEADAPFEVLSKVRRGDREVEVSLPSADRWRGRTPVLVDDIVSTARTMIAATRHFVAAGMAKPVCIAVHGIFAGDAYDALAAAGPARIVTCNTIIHPSNAIDVTDLVAGALRGLVPRS